MKAIVYYDFKDFRMEEIPTPEIGEEEILVKVKICGLCSTDIVRAQYHLAKPRSVLGHEVVGEVAEIGQRVTGLKIGERVAVYHHAQCGACYYCRHGQEPLCDQYRSTNIIPGGFAEYVRVIPELVKKSIVKLPEDMTYEDASLTEPTGCATRTITKCHITLGDTITIIGGGSLGLLNAQLAKYFGAAQVIVSDHHDFRIAKARELGIDYAFNSKKTPIEDKIKELTNGRGADIVVVAVASSEAVQEGLKLTRLGGKICLFGDFRDVPQPNLNVDPKLLLRDDVTIFGSWGCSPQDYRVAFDMIRMGRIRAREMITHIFPLERFQEAVDVMLGKECLKIIIKP